MNYTRRVIGAARGSRATRRRILTVGIAALVAAGIGAPAAQAQSSAESSSIGSDFSESFVDVGQLATAAEVATRNLGYSANDDRGIGAKDSVRWIDRTATSSIVVVAPHAVKHHRDGHLKAADTFTGGIAETVADRIGASVLTTTGEVSDWGEDWSTRNDEFTRILHSLPERAVIVDLHGMDDGSSSADISIGKSIKDSDVTRALAKRVRKAFDGDTVIDGKFDASSHYTVTRHMQERGHDGVQIEISKTFRDPAQLRVGHTVDALARALTETDDKDR